MTEHEKLQFEIPALAAGRLGEAEAQALEAHVATCESCRGVLATAREIAALSKHPDVPALRRHALGLDPLESASMESHLAGCASCSLEVAAWRRRPRRRARFAAFGAAAALAAALVLWLWLAPLQRRGPVLEPQVLVFSSALRDQGEQQVIDLEPGRDLLLRAEWETLEPASELGPLRLELRDGSSPVWSTTLDAARVTAALRAGSPVRAVVPAGTLGAGEYEFRMLRSRPDELPLIQERFRVRLLAPRPAPDATEHPR